MKLKSRIDKNLQTHVHIFEKAENQTMSISNSYKNSKLNAKKVKGEQNDTHRSPVNRK